MSKESLTYKDAGVDIDAGNELVERIKPLVKQTRRPEVLAGIGGFGGLFALPPGRYDEPVLVSGTDGVGTKLMLAQQSGIGDFQAFVVALQDSAEIIINDDVLAAGDLFQ